MLCFDREGQAAKGWFVGPWNSNVPVAIGYANEGVNEPHYHAEMYEIYLVAQGESVAVINGRAMSLEAGSVLIVEPGEVHTFTESTPDYHHFVVHTPVVRGDKHFAE